MRGQHGSVRVAGGGDARDASRQAAARLGTDSPPDSITGVKVTQPVGATSSSVRIDWFQGTCTGEHHIGGLTQFLEVYFGKWENGKGRGFYSQGRFFEGGAFLGWDGRGDCAGTTFVCLPGGALGTIDVETAMQVLLTLLTTFWVRCSRIDFAQDYRGERVTLLDQVLAEARANQACGFREWEPRSVILKGVELVTGVTAGKRGKQGSGKRLCVYDKGMETKQAPPRTWIRMELSLSGKRAHWAGESLRIVTATPEQCAGWYNGGDEQAPRPGEGWESFVLRTLLGAVDFRVQNGSRSRKRRPRVQWWAELLEGLQTIRIRAPRAVKQTLEGWKRWLVRTVKRRLEECMAETGRTIEQVLRDQMGTFQPRRRGMSRVAFEYGQDFDNWVDLHAGGGVLCISA